MTARQRREWQPDREVTVPSRGWIALPVLLLVCAGMVIVGALGPWATTPLGDVTGTDLRLGQVTLGLAAAAAVLALVRFMAPGDSAAVLAAIALGAAGVLAGVQWIDYRSDFQDEALLGLAEVGWGLQLATGAGLGALVLVFALMLVQGVTGRD